MGESIGNPGLGGKPLILSIACDDAVRKWGISPGDGGTDEKNTRILDINAKSCTLWKEHNYSHHR